MMKNIYIAYLAVSIMSAMIVGCSGGDDEETNFSFITNKGNITFKDQEVKSICVKNWDTNGDGELSYQEAANVTNLENSFVNSTIDSFDEFQFFTGITEIKGTYYHHTDQYDVRYYYTNGSFKNCPRLTSIILPKSLTYIGGDVFCNCSSLTNIVIPESVKELGHGMYGIFQNCSKLEEVTLSGKLTTIEVNMFVNCKNLKRINIPNSIGTIGSRAFLGCENLEEVKLTNGLFNIKNSAFSGCTKLRNIDLPESLKTIENEAFAKCSSLTNIIIPPHVININAGTFSDCKNLVSVTIKEGIKSINNKAFSGCSNLNSIHIINNTPPSLDNNGFDNTLYSTATLYVPKGSIGMYQSANNWQNFLKIVEE